MTGLVTKATHVKINLKGLINMGYKSVFIESNTGPSFRSVSLKKIDTHGNVEDFFGRKSQKII